MAMESIVFTPEGPLDSYLREQEEEWLQRGLEETLNCHIDKSDEEIAVELVKRWLIDHSYLQIGESNTTIVSGLEAAGVESTYLESKYWEEYFQGNLVEYKETFWSNLFEENNTNYRSDSVVISECIPDDPIHRIVLHHLRSWGSRLRRYLVDKEIPLDERKLVFTKQIENFVFCTRKKPYGCLWKMHSEPNYLLKEALDCFGVNVVRDEKGEPVKTVTGRVVVTEASAGLSQADAAGPSPDEMDQKIYDYVRRYAGAKLGKANVHDAWTMVKGCFNYNSKRFRCYAFSGKPTKQLNKMPLKWWNEKSGPEAWEDHEDVLFADGSAMCLGNGLVLALFKAMRLPAEEELKKVAQYTAFEKFAEVESLIRFGRKVSVGLDFGIFYDCVIKEVNFYTNKIKKAMSNFLKKKLPDIDTEQEKQFLCCLTVGGLNHQFKPNEQRLRDLLSCKISDTKEKEEICGTLCKISKHQLGKLEQTLNKLPGTFLDCVEKQLSTFNCGEDNVIDMVFLRLLKLDCDAFMKVHFVAMDVNHRNGKPFCAACAEKVKFYSILPVLLRFLGFKEDFKELDDLL